MLWVAVVSMQNWARCLETGKRDVEFGYQLVRSVAKWRTFLVSMSVDVIL
jgi:hypothetical protein